MYVKVFNTPLQHVIDFTSKTSRSRSELGYTRNLREAFGNRLVALSTTV